MTTTYSLGVDRHISQVHFPTQIRALLRRIEHNNSDVVEKARDLTQLIALFEEVQDAQKIRLYSGQLLNLAKKGKMKPGVGRSFAAGALLSHGRACLIVQDYDAAIDSFQQYALYGGKMSNPMDNRDIFFNSLFNLGLASLQRGESKQEVGDKSCTADFEDAHVKFLQLHSCFDKEKLTPEMRCDVLMNLGIVFGHQGNPQKALTCLEKSLKMAHERKDTDTISRAYFNLAALFKRVNNFDKALEYIKKELLIHKNSNNVEGCLETQYEIALLQQQMHKYQEAIVSTQTYIQLAKKLSDNNAGDKGLDLMRELEESVSNQKRIQVLSEKLVQLRSRKHSAAAGGGKREEFRVLMEIAGLKMSLHMFTDALKDFQTLNLIIQALPVSSQEKDAITKGLGDAYAGAGQFEDAVPQFRALLNRLTGLTKTRAEVLWKLADCLGHLEGTCEQIAAPLIECERIGVHLQDLQIQWEAQNRLSVLYNRFQYYEKAKRAEFIADQLDKRIDAEGISREKDYEEEEDNDGDNQDEDEDVVGGITGDACDDEDIISGSGSDAEESRWIKKHGKEKTRREVNGGRRTSAVVKKLDLKDDIESSQEINKKPRVKRRIIPLQSSSSWSQHAPAKQTKKTIMSSSSDVEDGGERVRLTCLKKRKSERVLRKMVLWVLAQTKLHMSKMVQSL
ncbi:hypothetical protein BDR26DRAFT_87654 [Obelidium mucronatum]|nr:hypothetical protein BDR26DRAFT_87654 [Obelidium mucronatum]